MATIRTVALPGSASAAASDGDMVWCAVGNELVAFAANGAPLYSAPAPPRLQTLASAGGTVAGTLEGTVLVWLDRRSGSVLARRAMGGSISVMAGGGAVWVLDTSTSAAWRLAEPGVLVSHRVLNDVDRVAPDGERIWWTARGDTVLTDGARRVDLHAGSSERGGIVVCAGSVWVSVHEGLVRVGTWAAERGPLVRAPAGLVERLVCADSVLVGGSRDELFALDPNTDADARRLDSAVGGNLHLLVPAGAYVWAFPTGRAEAHVVAVRGSVSRV